MPIERSQIERSLQSKGFVRDEKTNHTYFHHEVNGKKTGISTFVSRGSSYRTYSDSLVGQIKRQLRLDNAQTKRFLECPMNGAEYSEILKSKGLLN